MIVYRYDINGFYKEPVEIKDEKSIPADCTKIKPPEIKYKIKFLEGAWVETLTPTEIDELLNTPLQKSKLEILQETVDQLVLDNLMRGF